VIEKKKFFLMGHLLVNVEPNYKAYFLILIVLEIQ
jgi:hypothetical protein